MTKIKQYVKVRNMYTTPLIIRVNLLCFRRLIQVLRLAINI